MNKQQARRRKEQRAERARPDALSDQDEQLQDAAIAEHAGMGEPTEEERAAGIRQDRLNALAQSLAKKRKDAINARANSGIQEIWTKDEEHYEGIDDANRAEAVNRTPSKPRDFNATGGPTYADIAVVGSGSTVFVNITGTYVDFGAGRAADMLLPTDEQNWDLAPTPMPDVIGQVTNDQPLPLTGPLPEGAPSTIGQAALQMIEEARAKVAKAKTRIEDWLEECGYNAEQRTVLHDAAKVGVGVLKGPIPEKRIKRAVLQGETGEWRMEVQNKTVPTSKRISYWNLYPDPACGMDIQKGSYVWEEDTITARELRDLKGTRDTDGNPMYLEDAIDQVLKEGANAVYDETHNYTPPDGEVFRIWYYHGVAEASDFAAAGITVPEGSVLPVIVTTVNDRVIKVARSTLDCGKFPYDVMVWKPRAGHWAGIGLARQLNTPQRILNAAVRNMMDNAGLGAGPQFVMKKGVVKPMGKNADYTLRPRKMWEVSEDENIDDVRKAFAAIEVPMMTGDLMAIINFAIKMGEDVTGMPMMMQGQQGNASHTVGGMQLLNNNSNTPMRSIAKQYDDRITTPHLLRYYEFLLMYGEDNDEKGEFVVQARGSSALFERDAQNQAILAMAPFIKDPDFNMDPGKWFREFLRAQRLDPNRFLMTEEQIALRQKQMQETPPPADPRIEAARIAAENRLEIAGLNAGVQRERIQKDVDRDAVYVQAETENNQRAHEARMAELMLKRELAILAAAERENSTVQEIKARLADTTIKVNAQKELALATANGAAASRETTKPPTEPPGRAQKGEAWQQ